MSKLPSPSRPPSPPPHEGYEDAWRQRGFWRVAGVDEVGRGPLAGPVTAAAVVFRAGGVPAGLADSKKLTARRRAALVDEIKSCADWAVVHVSVDEIDRLNILRASHLAMLRAMAALEHGCDAALIDGNMLPEGLACLAEAIIRGDGASVSIAAASILAKEARDALMRDLAREFPGYGWERNAGYPTPAHKAALLELGVTPHHRRSFAPVHNILCKATQTSS